MEENKQWCMDQDLDEVQLSRKTIPDISQLQLERGNRWLAGKAVHMREWIYVNNTPVSLTSTILGFNGEKYSICSPNLLQISIWDFIMAKIWYNMGFNGEKYFICSPNLSQISIRDFIMTKSWYNMGFNGDKNSLFVARTFQIYQSGILSGKTFDTMWDLISYL